MSLIAKVTKRNPPDPEYAEEEVGISVGPFVVFGGEKWNITHTEEGIAVRKDCCCPIQAIAIAEAIIPLIDWKGTWQELQARGKEAKLYPIVREFKCPAGCIV